MKGNKNGITLNSPRGPSEKMAAMEERGRKSVLLHSDPVLSPSFQREHRVVVIVVVLLVTY